MSGEEREKRNGEGRGRMTGKERSGEKAGGV